MTDFLLGGFKNVHVQNDESNDPTEFHKLQSNFIPTWLCVWGRYVVGGATQMDR